MLTHLIIAFQLGCETVESSTYIVEHEFECFCNINVVSRDRLGEIVGRCDRSFNDKIRLSFGICVMGCGWIDSFVCSIRRKRK